MRIGAYQFAISGDVNENYKEIEKAIYLAKHKDVQLLIFPECSLTGYPPRDISNSSCVNFNLVQSMCDRLQSVADQNDISFIVGTIFKEKEIYNRALLFQPNKQIKSYDKRALWGWDNDNFAKGNSDGIVEIDGVVFGIRICFEIRFPEFLLQSFNRFLIISLDVLICRYSPLFRAFPALFISEEPHKSFYYPSCFRSQK